MDFPVFSKDSAPEGAAALLDEAEGRFGFVPNLLGVMASSPTMLDAYMTIGGKFAQSDFSPSEQQVVLMTVNRYNGCRYCMAAHSSISENSGVPGEIVETLRSGEPLSDPRLEALAAFTQAMLATQGRPSAKDVESFTNAGYGQSELLLVIVGIAMKTLSNYTNHIAETPIDAAFKARAWQEPS